ncbi:small nuclear RNA auxiliary factor 1 [Capsaspora owczarzaki ATCC 30864]|uniref:Small nuclear RNA auxiliary factor 1 n=2 Tax=Capsaspora owczarzaki (strain ATCC 30864) TaxID=595528 RepID=A0A0D2WH57_CAPO3|nr:small nuclear RNA auxiliary factor 1 [Capsaspora owczarzaki ATCC 30864]
MGACRHGARCSRLHIKPTFSPTILLPNFYKSPYPNPANPESGPIDPETMLASQDHFDEFYEDVFTEMEEKYGAVEEMNVCDNLSEHLVGNTYVKFRREEDAERAAEDLNNRWFDGRVVSAELSTVTDFNEACCRQYDIGQCKFGGFCNFMHIKPISKELRREIYGPSRDHRRRESSRSRSRSRSPRRR